MKCTILPNNEAKNGIYSSWNPIQNSWRWRNENCRAIQLPLIMYLQRAIFIFQTPPAPINHYLLEITNVHREELENDLSWWLTNRIEQALRALPGLRGRLEGANGQAFVPASLGRSPEAAAPQQAAAWLVQQPARQPARQEELAGGSGWAKLVRPW